MPSEMMKFHPVCEARREISAEPHFAVARIHQFPQYIRIHLLVHENHFERINTFYYLICFTSRTGFTIQTGETDVGIFFHDQKI
jgi:hypothetical protein